MWTALEGVMVAARYELRAHLATGGMAAVFRAWDHRLRRPVAIKVLRQLDNADDQAVERFRREARAAAALQNPHIVEIFDFFEENGCYYLVMELIEGNNLKQHLLKHGVVTPRFALSVAAQVCFALEAAHEQGFIHRDIKPQNVLLDTGNVAKLADFGIVHIPRAQVFTTGGMVLGTADYVSPEQAQGLPLRPTTDIYSLGVVLYELLSGALPFTGTTPISVALQHATAPVPAIRRDRPEIPESVERIVLRALRKEPRERFPSARAMRLVLERTLATLAADEDTSTLAVSTNGASEEAADKNAAPSSAIEWRTLADRLRQPVRATGDSEDGDGDGDGDADDWQDASLLAPAAYDDALASAMVMPSDAPRRLLVVIGLAILLVVALVILHLLV